MNFEPLRHLLRRTIAGAGVRDAPLLPDTRRQPLFLHHPATYRQHAVEEHGKHNGKRLDGIVWRCHFVSGVTEKQTATRGQS